MQKIENAQAAIRPVIEAKASPNACIIPEEKHEIVSHKDELRETGEISMKTIEGGFSLFKRGLIGSYHKLSKDHLDSYLQEFSWQYNRRSMQPWMFDTLVRELVTRKPLTYKTLTREIF